MMSIRKPIYAGSFYPAEKKVLLDLISEYFSQVRVKKFEGELKAVIVPHAGFIYSGQTAAFAFKLLEVAKPKRVVLFGPSHHDYFEGVFGFSGEWLSPLGRTKIASSGLDVIKNDSEHSLEVELPFLQCVLKSFDFVPLIYGDISSESLANVVDEFESNGTVFVASSDLSHFLSYDNATRVDSVTISKILSLDFNNFNAVGDACGKIGVGALILLAKKFSWKPILLNYRNSGDSVGDKQSVVGYCAIAFFR